MMKKAYIFPLLPVIAVCLMANKCQPEPVINAPTTYTKIDANGTPLVNQDVAFNPDDETASEANFDRWSCVQDDNTGLTWEIKTNDAGLRDANHVYTWYDTNPATNGGDHGIGDLGTRLTTDYELEENNTAAPYPGADDCYDSARCDTEKYVADVNAQGLCGATDWRLPTKEELETIVYTGEHRTNEYFIDNRYFYDINWIRNGGYNAWSATASETKTQSAYVLDFMVGTSVTNAKFVENRIRLVRGQMD